jgi:hypothetical protein
VFTQTIPLLFAGGVCACVVLAFGAAAGALAVAGVDAGLLACAGAALAEGVAAGAVPAALSVEVAVFDLLFFVVAVSGLPALAVVALPVALLLAVALSAASALLLFFEGLFLVAVAVSPAVLAVLLSFALLCDVGALVESALASVPLCDASAVAAFFLVFFLEAAPASLWSVEAVDPACCAPRVVTLPQISSIAASIARYTPLLDLMLLPPQLHIALRAEHTDAGRVGWVGVAQAFRADFPCWNLRIIPEKKQEVKVKRCGDESAENGKRKTRVLVKNEGSDRKLSMNCDAECLRA